MLACLRSGWIDEPYGCVIEWIVNCCLPQQGSALCMYPATCNELIVFIPVRFFVRHLADALTLTESTVVQVYGWDPTGTIVFNDVFCTNNSAEENGGCFHGSGKAIFNNGTVMLNNQGEHGGSICKRTQLQLFVFLFGSRGTAATAGMCFMGRFWQLNRPQTMIVRAATRIIRRPKPGPTSPR